MHAESQFNVADKIQCQYEAKHHPNTSTLIKNNRASRCFRRKIQISNVQAISKSFSNLFVYYLDKKNDVFSMPDQTNLFQCKFQVMFKSSQHHMHAESI